MNNKYIRYIAVPASLISTFSHMHLVLLFHRSTEDLQWFVSDITSSG